MTIVLPTLLPTLTPPPKTAQPLTPDVRTRWLAGQPCTPPCWEGITPGKTRLDEAVTILNWHPLVQNVEFWSRPDDREGMIIWRWQGSKQDGGQLGFVQVAPQDVQDPQDSTNPIVTWIRVSFPQSFSLSEIRAAYGDPSHVVPFAGSASLPDGSGGSTNYYEFTVVYLDHGFLLQTERELYGPPAIGPRMALSDSVVFFPPTMAGLEAVPVSTRGWKSTDLLPWQGFQDFRFYCQQIQPVADAQQRCPHMDE